MNETNIRYPQMWQLGLSIILGVGVASTSKILNPAAWSAESPAFFPSLWPGLVAMIVIQYYFVRLQAAVHADKIENRNVRIEHWKANVLRFVVGFAMASLIHAYAWNPERVVLLLLFGLSWFGYQFTVTLNVFRGKAPLYVSKSARASIPDRVFAWVDKKIPPYGGLLQVLFYAALGVLFALLYLK